MTRQGEDVVVGEAAPLTSAAHNGHATHGMQSMRGGRVTRYLPELHLDDGPESARQRAVRTRLTAPLGAGDALQVWDDRVVAGERVYPFDEWFGARLVVDPRAPLTVNPPLAVALISHDANWATYVPPNEQDAVRVIAAIRDACRRLSIEPIGIDDAVRLPEPLKDPEPRPFSWQAPQPEQRDEPLFDAVESLLVALVHLSIFFFPVALPVLAWRILSQAAPAVAAQAREAAEFQALFYAIALPTLGYTARMTASYGMQPAAVLGLLALGVLLLLAATCAFAGARQAMRGRGFSYREFARTAHGLHGLAG